MIGLNDLLRTDGLEPEQCTVMLHSDGNPRNRALIMQLFVQQRPLFDTFQRGHSRPAERTLRGRPYSVVFLAQPDSSCVFAGIYRIAGIEQISREDFFEDPNVRQIRETFGLPYDFGSADRKDEIKPWFDLELTDLLADFSGRLLIAPKLTRAYVRLAERLDAEVVELARESRFDPPLAEWRSILLTAAELRLLGPAAQARLAEWRGIYLIVDESDGARYVGSAYGETNLLGRWRAHISGEAGITAELQRRNTANLRFSILERVSPDMPAEDVISLEHTWMNRLHTRQFGLNA